MSDLNQTLPLFISTISTKYSSVATLGRTVATMTMAAATWVLNDIVYMPITIPFPYPVNRVWWQNGSTLTSSNAEFGIYTPSGAKIYSTGSVVMSGVSNPQYVTPSPGFILDPGSYYFALWCNNTTARVFGFSALSANSGTHAGYQTQAGLSALPANATFAVFSTLVGPLCGVTRTLSGF